MSSRKFGDIPVMRKPDENSGIVMKKLMKSVEDKYHIKFDGYWDFYKWSVEHIAEYWSEMWDFSGIVCSKKYDQVIDLSIPMEECPKWFVGSELNYAENLLKYRDDHAALIITGEDDIYAESITVTYAELYEEAKLYAAAFRKFGIQKGDVVVCYMSNRKEAILAMLATISIGAIWTAALPHLGPQAVLNRLIQTNPKLLLTVDRLQYNREEIKMLEKVKEIVDGLPCLEKVIIVPSKVESKQIDISNIRNSCFMEEFLQTGRGKDGSVPEMQFEQVSFSYPVFISYTSGTTGLPKPIVHGCGVLLSMARDFAVHSDATRESVWLAVSPAGWVSWNMVTGLISMGFTLLLFDGQPHLLSPTYVWDMVDKFKVSHIFLAASYLDEWEKRRYLPTKNHHLNSLKSFMAGGSVVKPISYDFVYNDLKLNCCFSSAYGCTELMGSAFIIEHTVPIYRGEIPVLTLGTAAQVLDESGKSVEGEIGEFVLTKSAPSILLGLWNDPDGSKFREKYFSKHPGKFLMGDNGMINPVTKGIIICGRSDDTLKQRGCRFGSSEIYNVVDYFPEIHDSLCVSQYNKDLDERAVLFLKIREGYSFDPLLVSRIREGIIKELTVRHIPDVIMEIRDIPYNMNGKKMEMLVKKIINKKSYNADSCMNPECLKYYENVSELRDF